MIRSKCIICDSLTFLDVFDIFTTINIVSDKDSEFLSDEKLELKFIGCKNCGCVQLKNLFDINKIYAEPMQCFNGPTLKKHYKLFNEFIIKNKDISNTIFFEVGGSYGRLAKLLIEHYNSINTNISYNILEFSIENYPEIKKVKYINGNCETYNFNGVNTIIMSHVFEHLYEPKIFLKNICNSNVKEVFISIPDMDSLTKIGDINNLNVYHTFYINTDIITYLFKLYNFVLKEKFYYENNSIFYYFVKEENNLIDNLELKNNSDIMLHQKIFYDMLKQNIQSINIDSEFFICPSGLYGRFIYFYLNENTRKNVIGFLDSDNMKIGKRLNGTPYYTYNKHHITNINKPIILIASKKHQIELIDELNKYNDKSIFYYL